jgi:dihydrofolate reductase
MRKLIAAINMTLDGFCDHTAVGADEETHQHYTDLIRSADTIVYGRITYLLMETYWPEIVRNPTSEKSTNDFAIAIDQIRKVVFSRTLKKLEWDSARIADKSFKEEIVTLKNKNGGDILIGSPSMIIEAMNLGLVDELQLMVHPVIVGKGLALFQPIRDRIELKLIKTKSFKGGAVLFYYEPKLDA